jgi:hypothetical protein
VRTALSVALLLAARVGCQVSREADADPIPFEDYKATLLVRR